MKPLRQLYYSGNSTSRESEYFKIESLEYYIGKYSSCAHI